MSLYAVAQVFAQQSLEIRGATGSLTRLGGATTSARRGLVGATDVTIQVGPGSDRSAEIYTRFFTRLTPSVGSYNPIYAEINRRLFTREQRSVGFSDADRAAADIYRSIQTVLNYQVGRRA